MQSLAKRSAPPLFSGTVKNRRPEEFVVGYTDLPHFESSNCLNFRPWVGGFKGSTYDPAARMNVTTGFATEDSCRTCYHFSSRTTSFSLFVSDFVAAWSWIS